jgi:hypothetical protein
VRLAVARIPLTLALTLLLCGCAAPERDLASYAIVGATLMDGTARVPIDNSVVVVEKGRISAMGTASEVKIPGDAKRIYGRGRFIFPLILDQPLKADGPADLILCEANPARDPDYMKKTTGRMEKGRWTQFPN